MVYVDDRKYKYRGMRMCHMIADTTGELYEMADRIGVNRKWIQCKGTPKEHFDICMQKRKLAIENGAHEKTVRQLAMIIVKRGGWFE